MRLLATLNNPDTARDFSELLKERKIKHEVDVETNKNWGDEHYGDPTIRIWIIEEEAFDPAWLLWGQYSENPNVEMFKLKPEVKQKEQKLKSNEEQARLKEKIIPLFPDAPISTAKPVAFFTRWLILACIICFMLELVTSQPLSSQTPSLYVSSPVNQTFLYDYPKTAELFTKVMKVWDPKAEQPIPEEAQILLKEAEKTPFWQGLYAPMVKKLRGEETDWFNAPLFEKIKEGEVWRLLTPIFLHGSLIHLLFNMMWLWVLGVDVERILKPRNFLILIIILGVVSNTLQYLMSGYNFVGISGVVSGLAFFTAERQRIAPWEGYTLQRSVFLFLAIYVFGLAALQGVFFLTEVAGFGGVIGAIGNTAHVGGALAGLVLARTSLFSWKG